MSTLCFYAQFTASKVGVNSLTVTWDVERITRSDGTRTALVTGGANGITVGRRGLYGYVLTNADLTLYDYIATAITSTTTVDLQEVPALWTLWSTSWHDIATSIMSIAGSIGKLLVDNIDDSIAAVNSYLAVYIAKQATADLIKAKTDNLPADPASQSLIETALADIVPAVAVSSTVAASVSSGAIGLQTFYTLNQVINSTVTANLSTATKLWLSIKDSAAEEDDKSLVFVEKTGGLSVLAKAAHTTTSDGDLVVTGLSGDWDISITLSASATGQLHGYYKNTKYAELKALVSGDTIVVWSGTAEISQGLIQSIT